MKPAPIDRATLAYVAVALAFTLARGPRTWPMVAVLPAGLLLLAAVAAFGAPRARRAGPLGQLLAEFYPLLATVGLYTHIGIVNVAGGVSHDALVQTWEQAVFGGQPSLEWIRAFPSPVWSTVMHAAYLSYYAILAGSPLGLWLSGRRRAARGAIFLIMATFYVCYTIFLAFPVAGPRYLFAPAENAATAVPIAVLAHKLLRGGSAWGTAFPSSHVAVTLVAAACAWRGFRALGAVLAPLAVLLSLATVYGQFHYAVDALAGTTLAAVMLIVFRRTGRESAAGVSGPAELSLNGARGQTSAGLIDSRSIDRKCLGIRAGIPRESRQAHPSEDHHPKTVAASSEELVVPVNP